jgi:replication fork protection complex subunit Tof1/Swi1
VLTTDGVPADVDPLDDSTSDEALRAQAAQLKGPSEAAIALFAPHNVNFGEDPETKEAASTDPHYKLLMRLLGWESEEGESIRVESCPSLLNLIVILCTAPESAGLVWSIPAPLPPSKLDSDLKIIDDFLLDPIDPQNGKSASDLLRKQRKKPVRRKRKIASEDEMELGEDGEPAPAKKKKRQKKREEEEAAYKSAQFVSRTFRPIAEHQLIASSKQIEDSDDDEEADARFFAAEAALRAKLAAGAVSVHLDAGTKKKKGPSASQAKAKKSRKSTIDTSSEDEDEPSTSTTKRKSTSTAKKSKKKDAATNARGRKKAKKTQFNTELVSDIEDDDGTPAATREEVDTAPSTSSPSTSTSSSRKRAVSVTSASSATVAATADGSDDEDEEEVVGVSQAKKRRVILDSDDE